MKQGEIWQINLDPTVSQKRLVKKTGFVDQKILIHCKEALGIVFELP